MKPNTFAPAIPSTLGSSAAELDIVVPFTTDALTQAALTSVRRLSAGLLPLVRMVKVLVVPYPLQLEAAPVAAATLRSQLVPLAGRYGAHVQICFTRDEREGLLYILKKESVILIAARSRSWRHWWPSREERLANWLRRRGYVVMLEFVEKNNA